MPRYLGQHFLGSISVSKRISESLDLKDGDTVIEIGPGHGELTERIADEFKRRGIKDYKLIGIEKDRRLMSEASRLLYDKRDIKIIEGDALIEIRNQISKIKIKNRNLKIIENLKIVGNIPYYITGYLLRVLGELEYKPVKTVLLVQKEVAQRICAKPPHSTLLSLSVQFWADPRIIENVSKKYFSPPPRVDSAVIELKTRIRADRKQIIYSGKEISADRYYSFIKKAFKQPRKTLLNNLIVGGYGKEKAINLITDSGLEPENRPSVLSREIIERYFCCP